MSEWQQVLDGERRWCVVEGDCREVMVEMPDASVDAVVTDPPYELGFMGKSWDASGIAYDPAMWAEVLRVLKPGGHLLAFGGTRTSHRMVCAIEDAGFEVRDSLCWLYGSGFPKSLDVWDALSPFYLGRSAPPEWSELADRYDGYGTALKPAHEPICLARKPLVGTVAANVTEHGTGALNVDGCRVAGAVQGGNGSRPGGFGDVGADRGSNEPCGTPHDLGRWPPNVLLDDEAAAMVGEQSGERPGGGSINVDHTDSRRVGMGVMAGVGQSEAMGDTGGASRFFPRFNAESSCILCCVPYTEECKANAQPAGTASPPAEPLTVTAPGHAAQSGAPSPEGTASASSRRPVAIAASRSETTPATAAPTAPRNVTTQPGACLVQRVQSAANLCASCATDIARNIAATQRARAPVSLVGLGSMTGHRRRILSRSLALFAASPGPSDTTPTTAELRLWSGYVESAISTSTTEENRVVTGPGQPRFLYQSKAGTAEREAGLDAFAPGQRDDSRDPDAPGANNPRNRGGQARRNTHPTVKPVDLMRWLVRLVTPPRGLVLDPFCGSGTTGMACALEEFRFVGIELDEQHAEIARARIVYAVERRGRPLAAPKVQAIDKRQLPLFGEDAGAAMLPREKQ